jgi:hypothetical protein
MNEDITYADMGKRLAGMWGPRGGCDPRQVIQANLTGIEGSEFICMTQMAAMTALMQEVKDLLVTVNNSLDILMDPLERRRRAQERVEIVRSQEASRAAQDRWKRLAESDADWLQWYIDQKVPSVFQSVKCCMENHQHFWKVIGIMKQSIADDASSLDVDRLRALVESLKGHPRHWTICDFHGIGPAYERAWWNLFDEPA